MNNSTNDSPEDCANSFSTDRSEKISSQNGIITITEYPQSAINPIPRVVQQNDDILEEFLSPRRLKQLSGKENLEEVTYLKMCVDSERVSLGSFGEHVPNLKELKLSNGIIPRIRDLGTSLPQLTILWMPHCCLECLYGVSSIPKLKELYLSYNELVDISPLGMLENLEILDLEGNLISEDANLSFLAMCSKLRHLTLAGNPIAKNNEMSVYRKQILDSVPQLEILDDEPVNEKKQSHVKSLHNLSDNFTEEWNHIDEIMKEIGLVKNNKDSIKDDSVIENSRLQSGRVGNQFPLTASAKRRLQPALTDRKGNVINCGLKASPLVDSKTANQELEDAATEFIGESCEVMCGNIGRALRKNPIKRININVDEDANLESELIDLDYGRGGEDLEQAIDKLNSECDIMLNMASRLKSEFKKTTDVLNVYTDANTETPGEAAAIIRNETTKKRSSTINAIKLRASSVSKKHEEELTSSTKKAIIKRNSSNSRSRIVNDINKVNSEKIRVKNPEQLSFKLENNNVETIPRRISQYAKKLLPLRPSAKFERKDLKDESTRKLGAGDELDINNERPSSSDKSIRLLPSSLKITN